MRLPVGGDFGDGLGGGDLLRGPATENQQQAWANCNWTRNILGLSGCSCGSGDCKCYNRDCKGGGCQPPTCQPQPMAGPTDDTILAGNTWWTKNALGLSRNGRPVPGFGVGAGNGTPDIYASLSAAQQAWVQAALGAWLNDATVSAWIASANTQATPLCPGVSAGMVLSTPAALQAAVACFQNYLNTPPNNQGGTLTTGGTFDQMTAAALMATAAAATWGAGVGSCPGNCGIAAQPASGSASSSSSTIYYVAGGLAIAIIGGVLWMGRSHKRTAA